jgi:hypothetical protein
MNNRHHRNIVANLWVSSQQIFRRVLDLTPYPTQSLNDSDLGHPMLTIIRLIANLPRQRFRSVWPCMRTIYSIRPESSLPSVSLYAGNVGGVLAA